MMETCQKLRNVLGFYILVVLLLQPGKPQDVEFIDCPLHASAPDTYYLSSEMSPQTSCTCRTTNRTFWTHAQWLDSSGKVIANKPHEATITLDPKGGDKTYTCRPAHIFQYCIILRTGDPITYKLKTYKTPRVKTSGCFSRSGFRISLVDGHHNCMCEISEQDSFGTSVAVWKKDGKILASGGNSVKLPLTATTPASTDRFVRCTAMTGFNDASWGTPAISGVSYMFDFTMYELPRAELVGCPVDDQGNPRPLPDGTEYETCLCIITSDYPDGMGSVVVSIYNKRHVIYEGNSPQYEVTLSYNKNSGSQTYYCQGKMYLNGEIILGNTATYTALVQY